MKTEKQVTEKLEIGVNELEEIIKGERNHGSQERAAILLACLGILAWVLDCEVGFKQILDRAKLGSTEGK